MSVGSLAGCFLIDGPTSPVSLHVDGDQVEAVLCLDEIEVRAMRVDYRQYGSDYATAVWSYDNPSAEGGVFQKGDAIVIGAPVGDIKFRVLSPLPTDKVFENVSIRIGYNEGDESGYVWPNFTNVDTSALGPDQYLYEDGRISDQPCGMYD